MLDTRLAPYALTLLRLSLGTMFLAHAWLKFGVFTMPGFAGFLGQVGLPGALAWPIVLAEFLGGLALILGVQARLVSLALVPLLLGAMTVHLGNGWVFNAPGGGWEYPAFLVVGALVQAAAGDGAFAMSQSRLPAGLARLAPAA